MATGITAASRTRRWFPSPGEPSVLPGKGYVVFTYDMVGQNDTNQVPHDWLDARQDLWNIGSSMGIHLWNSIRATDFLTSLPDVDPNRIAATGASGGGTQTFFLMAVDERIKVAAPVNMISATSQGGGCQAAANLRAGWTDFSNMVVGALMAPRPLILISNGGDWTVETPKEVFPAIQSIYRLLGVENNVTNVHFPQFIHNYNKESREAVYQFFNQHILNNPAPVAEPAFRVDFPHELLALHGRARPANAITGLDQLVENHIRDARAMTERLQPRDAATLAAAREAFAERLTFSLLALPPKPAELLSEKKQALPTREDLLIGRAGKGDRVPAVWLAPSRRNQEVAPTLVVHPKGVAGVVDSALVKTILNRGGIVMSIDAFQTGSAVAPRDTTARAFTAYNQTNDANRVQDILTALEYLRSRSKAQTVNLVGLEVAGVWSYFARAMAGQGVNLVADLAQFAADTDSEYLEQIFHPWSAQGRGLPRGGRHELAGARADLQCRPAISSRLGSPGCESCRKRLGSPYRCGRRAGSYCLAFAESLRIFHSHVVVPRASCSRRRAAEAQRNARSRSSYFSAGCVRGPCVRHRRRGPRSGPRNTTAEYKSNRHQALDIRLSCSRCAPWRDVDRCSGLVERTQGRARSDPSRLQEPCMLCLAQRRITARAAAARLIACSEDRRPKSTLM